jgi:ABC-type maltose transport system permease subunit
MVTNFVARWNDYSFAQINLTNYPNLAYGMFLYQTGSNWSADGKVVYYASLVMSGIPGIILYACFQGLIVNNISVGGLKG